MREQRVLGDDVIATRFLHLGAQRVDLLDAGATIVGEDNGAGIAHQFAVLLNQFALLLSCNWQATFLLSQGFASAPIAERWACARFGIQKPPRHSHRDGEQARGVGPFGTRGARRRIGSHVLASAGGGVTTLMQTWGLHLLSPARVAKTVYSVEPCQYSVRSAEGAAKPGSARTAVS